MTKESENKVYVVVYSAPQYEEWYILGVFCSKEEAEAYQRYKIKKHDYDNPKHWRHNVDIEEYELGEPVK